VTRPRRDAIAPPVGPGTRQPIPVVVPTLAERLSALATEWDGHASGRAAGIRDAMLALAEYAQELMTEADRLDNDEIEPDRAAGVRWAARRAGAK
jgi:hypothetical protein